jgi:hypothetical protein
VVPDVLPKFLVCGPVMRHEISIVNGGSGLEARRRRCRSLHRDGPRGQGEDLEQRHRFDRRDAVVAGYQLRSRCRVLPRRCTPSSLTRWCSARTDLRFVRRLARRNGFWFWITSEAPMVNIAHFKRFAPGGSADVEFKINAQGRQHRFRFHRVGQRAAGRRITQAVSLSDKSVIDGSVDRSPLTGLAEKALADIVSEKRSAPHRRAGRQCRRSQVARRSVADRPRLVRERRVTARLSVLKQIVRAHTVASIGGIGKRHSGKYVVARVVHDIDADDHVMTVDLVRNAWN